MPGEFGPPPFNPESNDPVTKPESDGDKRSPLRFLDKAFNRLPHLLRGDMHKEIYDDFPFNTKPIWPWEKKAANKAGPVVLDEIKGVPQLEDADCVGAAWRAAFNQLTGVELTNEEYKEFLQSAVKHHQAQSDNDGIKITSQTFNVFSTSEFRDQYNLDVTVALRRNQTIKGLSEIVNITQAKKNPAYKLYIFLPFPSWENPRGGHMVTLKEIGEQEVKVYDPHLENGKVRSLPLQEFNKRWAFDDYCAIFVFSKPFTPW